VWVALKGELLAGKIVLKGDQIRRALLRIPIIQEQNCRNKAEKAEESKAAFKKGWTE
jgi:hypothetical protein